MRGILFDKDAHTALGWQVANPPAEGGEPDPLKWHGLLNRFAQEHTGEPIRRFTLARILRRGNCLMAWQLTPGAILAAQLGRLVYLHWGGVPKQAIRLAVMRATLKRAQIVLVNDAAGGNHEEISLLKERRVVILEALACGLPVIKTKGAPWQPFEDVSRPDRTPSQPARAGWWIDIGIEPLVTALREAMHATDAERASIGNNSRWFAREKYSWSAAARAMSEAYGWLLAGGPPPACIRLASAAAPSPLKTRDVNHGS